MSAMAWLAVPVVALLLGVLWVMWASRERPRADTHETVQEHERFKAAFEPSPRNSRDSHS
jgi:cytochrome c-type biogenesis protein CcmH/NrfF